MQTWQQYYAISDQISGKIVNGYLARKGISGFVEFEVMHGPRARACGGTSPRPRQSFQFRNHEQA
jgi:hypothetical protein